MALLIQKQSTEGEGVKNFAEFARKYLYQSLFFNTAAGLRFATLLNKRLWYRCFLVNFVKLLRTALYMEHLRWLFLLIVAISTVLF